MWEELQNHGKTVPLALKDILEIIRGGLGTRGTYKMENVSSGLLDLG